MHQYLSIVNKMASLMFSLIDVNSEQIPPLTLLISFEMQIEEVLTEIIFA